MRNEAQAIKAYCRMCSGGSIKDVRECRVYKCPLYSFRTGNGGSSKGVENNAR